jgi:hypothetical protein
MEAVGDFDCTLWAGEEADYWIRSAIMGFQIVGTGKQTYYYRKSAESLSAAPARMAEGAARIFEKHRGCGILPEEDLAAKARDHYFAAGKLFWRNDAAAAQRNFYKSWVLDKLQVMPLLCFFGASGLRLARPHQRNGARA